MRLRVLFKAIFESKMREKVSDSNSKEWRYIYTFKNLVKKYDIFYMDIFRIDRITILVLVTFKSITNDTANRF